MGVNPTDMFCLPPRTVGFVRSVTAVSFLIIMMGQPWWVLGDDPQERSVCRVQLCMCGLELSGWPLSSNVMTRMPGSSGCTKVLPTGQS